MIGSRHAKLNASRDEVSRLGREVKRLREWNGDLVAALEPFAAEADRIHPDWADERRRVTLTPSKQLTVDDFRRARAALKNTK